MSFDCAKPPASARIKYLPGVKPVKVKLPSAPEVVVFCAPEASVKVTVAPTITAPTSSFTAPRKVTRPCALTSVTDNARTATAKAKYPIRFFMFIINFFFFKILATQSAATRGDAARFQNRQRGFKSSASDAL